MLILFILLLIFPIYAPAEIIPSIDVHKCVYLSRQDTQIHANCLSSIVVSDGGNISGVSHTSIQTLPGVLPGLNEIGDSVTVSNLEYPGITCALPGVARETDKWFSTISVQGFSNGILKLLVKQLCYDLM